MADNDSVSLCYAGYRGELGDWLYLTHQCQLDIAPSLGQSGFVVVPLRWIVERTFSWFGWFRRLTLDYERSAETAEAMVYIASIYFAKPYQMTFKTGS